MFEAAALIKFSLAALALVVVPGPAVLYIVTRSIDQGRLAGIVSVLGINTGVIFHAGAAALGVSAVLATSALAFSMIKWLGAAYLIYLGIRKWLTPVQPIDSDGLHHEKDEKLRHIFTQGIVVNVLNPKAALFFLLFLPQFVNPDQGSAALQILALGGIFAVIAIISDGMYALLAGTVREVLRRSSLFNFGQRYVSGGIYVALGLTTALAGSNNNQ